MMGSHGREGTIKIHRIADSTMEEEASCECASLTYMKASIAANDSSVLFVPGKNDSVRIVLSYDVDRFA